MRPAYSFSGSFDWSRCTRRGFGAGQAAIFVVLFLLVVSLAVAFSFSFVVLRELAVAQHMVFSKQVYEASEAGLEDLTYRVKTQKQYDPNETVPLGAFTTDVTVASVGSTFEIVSQGDVQGAVRTTKSVLANNTTGVGFFYGVQVSDGGLSMGNNARVNGDVYSNGSIVGANGAWITNDAIVAGGISSNPSVEWVSHDADQFFATAAGNRDIAQSFTANATDRLNRVSVYVAKVGDPANDLALRITNDSGGKPATSDLASAIISKSQVGVVPSWINVSFQSPPNLTAGSTYWIVLDYGVSSAVNHWNWRKDSTDAYPGNTGRFTSNWSAGGAVWTDVGGDLAFRVWIGGVATKIDGMVIGDAAIGTARANLFVDTEVRGSDCPNPFCVVDNPPREEMPISDGVIQDWRNAAAAGGTCVQPQCDAAGNYKLDNFATGTLGPKKITGNLELDNGAELTITGTLWVAGEVKLSNNCLIKLDSAYGSNSGVIVTDSKAVISNNCAFQGSGAAGSYVMLLSARDAPLEEVMTVDNNSAGVIYYASRGIIKFSNNATAKEATGYGIRLDNNAVITYDSGLASALFSSGPSGGRSLTQWREVP